MSGLEEPGIPTLATEADRYHFAWPDIGIEAEVERIFESRDDLKAEVTVRTARPPSPGLVHSASLSLMNTQSRKTFVGALVQRDPDVDWQQVVEGLCILSRNKFRAGEPAKLLSEIVPRTASAYALSPLVLRDGLTLIYGRPGDGKSLLALMIACALATGRSDLLQLAPASRLRIGYCDWEGFEVDTRERAEMAVGSELPEIVYVPCRMALWDEVGRLQRLVRERHLDFLIFDSVAYACGGLPPDSSEAALRFGAAYRRLAIGGLALAHLPKDISNNDGPFGSVFWNALARLTWLVKRTAQAGPGNFTLGLFNKKQNNTAAVHPLSYEVSFSGQRVRFQRKDVRDVPELAPEAPLHWRMQKLLGQRGPLPHQAIADELDAKIGTVKKAVQRGAGEGGPFVVLDQDGVKVVALLAREPD